MTPIAAYVEKGLLPAMIGDSLITNEKAIATMRSVPTWHNKLEGGIAGDRKIVDLRQKIVKISERMCVAWTGRWDPARRAMLFLREFERKNAPQMPLAALRAELARDRTYNDADLICMCINPDGGAVQWTTCLPPTDIGRFKGVHYGGTGGNAFDKAMLRQSLAGAARHHRRRRSSHWQGRRSAASQILSFRPLFFSLGAPHLRHQLVISALNSSLQHLRSTATSAAF